MKTLFERILEIKESCIRCWADEVSDIFPQTMNRKLAGHEMERRGNPVHTKRGLCKLASQHESGSEK